MKEYFLVCPNCGFIEKLVPGKRVSNFDLSYYAEGEAYSLTYILDKDVPFHLGSPLELPFSYTFWCVECETEFYLTATEEKEIINEIFDSFVLCVGPGGEILKFPSRVPEERILLSTLDKNGAS